MTKKLVAATSRAIYFLSVPVVYVAFKNSTRAYVLLESSGQILFVKSWFGNQKYKLPGGGVKKAENPKDGAVRELFEETGIRLDSEELQEISNTTQSYHGATYNQVIYRKKLEDQVWPKAKKLEIMEAAWLNPSQIDEAQFGKSTVDAVRISGFGL